MEVPYVELGAEHEPIKEEILEAVEEVLDHGWFILGEEVAELEDKIADYLGVPHVLGVGSGTDALELGMRARGIGEGDEVITVSHTWVSGVSAIDLVGATPVFVDVDPETMLMDPAALDGALTDRTAAVMPVHLNGFPCDLDPIREFCRDHDLTLIEDCAQALGTEYGGEPVGTIDIGCFSLHPLKVLSACGDGGLIGLHDDREAEVIGQLRNNGRETREQFPRISDNSRLDTLQAAILLVKLRYFERRLEARRENAAAYREAFADLPDLQLPPGEPEANRSVYSMFVVRHPRRDELKQRLADRGIDAKVHYPFGVHEQPPFETFAPSELPHTEQVVDRILSLPVSPELSLEQRETVIEAVCDEVQKLAE